MVRSLQILTVLFVDFGEFSLGRSGGFKNCFGFFPTSFGNDCGFLNNALLGNRQSQKHTKHKQLFTVKYNVNLDQVGLYGQHVTTCD